MIDAMKKALEALTFRVSPDKELEAIAALRQAIAEAERQEPVAVWELQEGGWNTIADADWMETLSIGTKLYTAPPKRQWVDLTETEAAECWTSSTINTWKRIQAKLKELNQ